MPSKPSVAGSGTRVCEIVSVSPVTVVLAPVVSDSATAMEVVAAKVAVWGQLSPTYAGSCLVQEMPKAAAVRVALAATPLAAWFRVKSFVRSSIRQPSAWPAAVTAT